MKFWISNGSLAILSVYIIFTVSVTGVQIRITPSSKTLIAGQALKIECAENTEVFSIWLERNKKRVVTYSYNIQDPDNPKVEWGNADGNFRQRSDPTGAIGTNSYVTFLINNTVCDDSAMFQCHTMATAASIPSISENVTVHGVTQYPTLSGGLKCDNFNPDCDKCFQTNPMPNSMPVFVRKADILTLICSGTALGLPKSANSYRWFKKRPSDLQRLEIVDNITTTINEPGTGACTTTGSSTLMYHPIPSDAGLVLICVLRYDNYQVSSAMDFERNQSVCVEAGVSSPTTVSTTTPIPVSTTEGLCRDKLPDCHSYGNGSCYGIYEDWARENCPAYCGYNCPSDYIEIPPHVIGDLTCPGWKLPRECEMRQVVNCCPIPDCPTDYELTAIRKRH